MGQFNFKNWTAYCSHTNERTPLIDHTQLKSFIFILYLFTDMSRAEIAMQMHIFQQYNLYFD